MSKPLWITREGNLGTIEEGVFFELLLDAKDPNNESLSYRIIAGFMPPGLVINEQNGTISGRPKESYLIRGVPFDVSEDVTSTFCCRVTNESGFIADRTFSITVTGQDAPVLITPEQELARVFDGTFVDIQLEFEDLDNEPVSWKISAGLLPPGLSIDSVTGRISGYAEPVVSTASADTVGWSAPAAGWQEFLWEHSVAWINQNYQFTVEITDGKEYAQKTYTIFVLSKNLLTGDLESITADDNNLVTADLDNKRAPVLVTQPADLGIFEHDNYFSFQFQGIDFDFDQFEFGLISGDGNGFDSILGSGFDIELFDQGDLAIPPGLTLNAETGWLFGYIQSQIPAQQEYNFAVYVYKKNDPSVRSKFVYFTITVVSDLARAIIWQSPTDLGSIATGEISELEIRATSKITLPINYSLVSGSTLPQGLRLLNNGLIIGRASFEYTSFDSGITTFDKEVRELGARLTPITFDQTYRFTVRAASPNNELLAFRTFAITIDPGVFAPYEGLYLRANPGQESKNLFLSITKNTDIIPNRDVYRNGDPYFGRASDARFLLIDGLNAAPAEDYISTMAANHYRKDLKFGEPKLSRALDINQRVIYEVLYYELIDDQETSAGSVAKKVNLVNKINRNITIDTKDVKIDNTFYTMDGAGDRTVYPNSLANMRTQLVDEIGLSSREVLPKWMINRQADGSIIGWNPAVIIAYLKPGAGERALFNLKRRIDLDQKLISFDFDRYIWDSNLSKTFDARSGEYLASAETTLDVRQDFSSPAPVATVDFALNLPFNQYDGRLTRAIDTIGGLDGIVGVYEGKTVIFAVQEQYTGFNEPNQGWIRNLNYWDDVNGWDRSAATGWDDYEFIDGFQEKQADPNNIINQRAGVWKFVRDPRDNLLRLEFQQEISQGETVFVRGGFTYGGYLLQYDSLIRFSEGKTVPDYRFLEDVRFTTKTTFDNNNTKFISNIVTYEDPDQSDKYLVFPKTNIWA